MKADSKSYSTDKPRILTNRIEDILRAIYCYRYMTALDVAYLLFSPKSLNYVRRILCELAGGADFQTHQYLYRFPIPAVKKSEKVYTLGARGRDFLETELGLTVDWYYRPDKVRHLSYSHLAHHLTLTRFLVAAQVWTVRQTTFRLAQVRTGFELSRLSAAVTLTSEGKKPTLKVIPDAWLLFERLKQGRVETSYPVLLEIDRGSEFSPKFKEHIRGRIEFIKKGGLYSKIFGTDAVIIAYATTGGRPEYAETRRRAMCTWTQEVLTELGKPSWAGVFRFHKVDYLALYQSKLFEAPVWYYPGSEKAVTLFPM